MFPLRTLMDRLDTLSEKELANEKVKMDPVTSKDLEKALASTKPTAAGSLQKYFDWEKAFGSS